ncbi:hypothetical protein HG531_005997 [Fusarium graminearum]|nr:hypothetical protein HG531_005997 [Fusarium graminearum]
MWPLASRTTTLSIPMIPPWPSPVRCHLSPAFLCNSPPRPATRDTAFAPDSGLHLAIAATVRRAFVLRNESPLPVPDPPKDLVLGPTSMALSDHHLQSIPQPRNPPQCADDTILVKGNSSASTLRDILIYAPRCLAMACLLSLQSSDMLIPAMLSVKITLVDQLQPILSRQLFCCFAMKLYMTLCRRDVQSAGADILRSWFEIVFPMLKHRAGQKDGILYMAEAHNAYTLLLVATRYHHRSF